jgi:hypothetical protein
VGHLFVEVLRLCREAGLVTLGHVSLDGSKYQANASKHKAMCAARAHRHPARFTDIVASAAPVAGVP